MVRVLREADVRAALDMRSCIDAMEAAFTAYSSGAAELPAVIHLDVPEHGGEIHIKAGHLHGESRYALKVSSGFGADASIVDGMVVVFDAETGAPAAFLMDHGYITDVRTGAAGGVAARHLAPKELGAVAVIGTGAQARYQLEGLACERPYREARIWGRNAGRARAAAEDLSARPWLPPGARVRTVSTVEEAVTDADVVITVTASREPLLRADWLAPGAHVTAVGSDGPDKQELEAAVLGRADLVVADSRAQCARIGEIHHALDAGALEELEVVELGEITAGRRSGRTSEGERTVADLTGVGVQDVAAAALVLENAGDAGELLEI
ncbi:MAG TPA: ornithine cyclodeaminase family protein [Actinomycetota bacterium]|jgi:ornithine cyclodeaminase